MARVLRDHKKGLFALFDAEDRIVRIRRTVEERRVQAPFAEETLVLSFDRGWISAMKRHLEIKGLSGLRIGRVAVKIFENVPGEIIE